MCITKILLTTFPYRFSPILLLKLPNRKGFERQSNLFDSPSTRSFLYFLLLPVGTRARGLVGVCACTPARSLINEPASLVSEEDFFRRKRGRAFEVVGGVLRRFFVFLRLCAGPSSSREFFVLFIDRRSLRSSLLNRHFLPDRSIICQTIAIDFHHD